MFSLGGGEGERAYTIPVRAGNNRIAGVRQDCRWIRTGEMHHASETMEEATLREMAAGR